MKRTKQPGQTQNANIGLQGEPIQRVQLAQQLGVQYQGQRDIYQALGYSKQLALYQYIQAYERQDIARKINNAPVQATWRGDIKVTDSAQESAFDEAWDNLSKRLRIWNKIARLDRLVGLGQYAVLVLGFDDVTNARAFQNPVRDDGNRQLLYMHPYHQINSEIYQFDEDPKSERYGLPLLYRIRTGADQYRTDVNDIYVHHTRVIHVAESLLESDVYGTPRLKAVYNRLEDLMKIVGGSAEMFWRGAKPGYAAKADSQAPALTPEQKEEFQQQLQEYEHDLRRWLRLQGIDIEQLSPQVADPSNHVDIQISMIAAASGIPKRILIGSERGELSSNQDETNWNQNVQDRREQYADPAILRPLIDRLINYGVLPEPEEGDYDIQWPDLFSPSESEKATTASNIANALKAYTNAAGADTIVPVKMFLSKVMGWPEEDVEKAMEEFNEMEFEEDQEAAEDEGGGALEETEEE